MNRPERPRSVLSDLFATRETPNRPLFAGNRPRGPRSRRQAARPTEQRSLFGEILDWMFAPLLLMWPLSVAITFLVARSLADVPFDRSLHDRAIILAQQVRTAPTIERRSDLERKARELFDLENADERVYYQVTDENGALLAGDRGFPRPELYDFPDASRVRLRNTSIGGEELRVAYIYVTLGPSGGDRQVLVQVGETLEERARLANEIIKGVIFPQFLILPVALGLVWFGLARGLAPLKSMQQRIRERRPDDLSPVDPRGAPEEIAPLVDAFNDLLGRQSQSIRAQRRFIADAAHQMKTPLAGLRLQAELARRETDPKQLQRSLDQLVQSAARSAHLINQLLSLARMENLRDATPLELLDLQPLVRAVAADWTVFAMKRRIDFGIDHVDMPAPVAGHPLLLRELLSNLIDNALRYTHEGGIVTVRVRSTLEAVLLEVEDDGPGIAPAERELIFERFYRVPGVPGDGSGLGLPIVREIAELHGAEVLVSDGFSWPQDRGPGFGTCMTIVFQKPQECL